MFAILLHMNVIDQALFAGWVDLMRNQNLASITQVLVLTSPAKCALGEKFQLFQHIAV